MKLIALGAMVASTAGCQGIRNWCKRGAPCPSASPEGCGPDGVIYEGAMPSTIPGTLPPGATLGPYPTPGP